MQKKKRKHSNLVLNPSYVPWSFSSRWILIRVSSNSMWILHRLMKFSVSYFFRYPKITSHLLHGPCEWISWSQSCDFRGHPSPTGTDSHFCCTWVASSRPRSLALTPSSCISLGTRRNWYGETRGEKITGLVVLASFIRPRSGVWIELTSA